MHRALYFAYIYNPPPLSLAKIFHSFLPFSFFFSFFLSTRNIEDDFSAIRVIIIGFVIHAFLVLVSRVKEDERTPGSERGKEGRKEGRKGFSWEVGAGEHRSLSARSSARRPSINYPGAHSLISLEAPRRGSSMQKSNRRSR